MGTLKASLDPYEIPAHLIPPGMIFQWVSKKTEVNRIDPQYQQMLEAGWGEVPYERMEQHYCGHYRGQGQEILIGGQVLMERARVASVMARENEIYKALINAAQGKPPVVRVAKYRWLNWLFNLISKETTEHFDG